MVHPDADNTSTQTTNDSVSYQKSIPVSCHKHTIAKIRSVRIDFFIIISLVLCVGILYSPVKFSFGQKKLVVLYLVHSIGAMHQHKLFHQLLSINWVLNGFLL